MKLGEKQELFMRLLPRLIDKAHELGFEIRGGDLFRDPRAHGQMNVKQGYGAPNSCHKLKLAIDLNLFKDGAFIQTTEGHRELGEWWEQQHELCRWGFSFCSVPSAGLGRPLYPQHEPEPLGLTSPRLVSGTRTQLRQSHTNR